LFAGMTAEFIMVQAVASPTFFLLLVISFVDFVAGVISAFAARARRRELMIEREPYPGPVVAHEPRVHGKPEPKPEPKFEPKPEVKPDTTPSEPSAA